MEDPFNNELLFLFFFATLGQLDKNCPIIG